MSLPIELPEDLREFVVRQASCEGFASSEDYVIELLVRERKRLNEDRLIALLQEGVDSGDPVEFTPEWWTEERTRMREGRWIKKRATKYEHRAFGGHNDK